MSAPAVAVLADGKKFVAAWKDKRTGEPNVFWTASSSLNFSDDEPVHDKLDGEQNHPSLAVDQSGNVWVAWEDSRSRHQQIRVRSSADASDRAVSDEHDGKASFPVVASNAKIVAVVYEAKRDRKESVVFRLLQQ